MYNPATKILETWAIVHGDKPEKIIDDATWYDQCTTEAEAREVLARRYNDPFPIHIEKWTFKREENGDRLISKTALKIA